MKHRVAENTEPALLQRDMPILSREEMAILDHTLHRAVNQLYCGDSPEMQQLVRAGLMEFAGTKPFVPDPYFRITAAGREAWKQQRVAAKKGSHDQT